MYMYILQMPRNHLIPMKRYSQKGAAKLMLDGRRNRSAIICLSHVPTLNYPFLGVRKLKPSQDRSGYFQVKVCNVLTERIAKGQNRVQT